MSTPDDEIPTRWTRLPRPSCRSRRYREPCSPDPAPPEADASRTTTTRRTSSRKARREPAAEDDVFSEGPPPEVAYPDDVFSEGPVPDIVHPNDVFSEGPPETVADDDVYSDDVFSEPDYSEPAQAVRTGRHHAAVDGDEADEAAAACGICHGSRAPPRRPTIHMPLADPYQVPDGYPVKASARSGLYYTARQRALRRHLAEIWFASEDAALASGFVKAD